MENWISVRRCRAICIKAVPKNLNKVAQDGFSVIRSPLITPLRASNWSPGWAVPTEWPVNTGNMGGFSRRNPACAIKVASAFILNREQLCDSTSTSTMERETFALVDNLSTMENSDKQWRKNQELFFAPHWLVSKIFSFNRSDAGVWGRSRYASYKGHVQWSVWTIVN